jgi:membrane fusion protein, multidrug efflux system
MKKVIRSGTIAMMAAVLALAGCGEGKTAVNSANGHVPEVEVVDVHLQNLSWDQTYPGRVEGIRRAEVRPRVGGIIVKRSYVEGSVVTEGTELFKIDPVPYELAVDRAQADYDHAIALEKQAGRDLARINKLFETASVSEKQHDDAISTYDLAKASTLGAKAALRQAQVNLGYTSVTAPVSGVTGMEEFTEGSLVSSADKLTVVTQLDPIYVQFSLPEGDPAYQQLFANGSRHKEGSTAMTLFTRNGSAYSRSGQVNFSETGLDPQTGSVRMRVEFQNPEGVLLPGQFARLAFKDLKLQPCAVIPEAAVLMTQMAAIVYVVDEKSQVAARPVILGPVLKEGQLVTAGLKDGDRVIFTSLIRLRPGMPVVAKSQADKVEAPKAPAASK